VYWRFESAQGLEVDNGILREGIGASDWSAIVLDDIYGIERCGFADTVENTLPLISERLKLNVESMV
jgi:hypothetical protein